MTGPAARPRPGTGAAADLPDLRSALPPAVRADVATFAARAARLDPGGVLRLQLDRGLVAATVRARPGSGLLGHGTILGLRAMAVPLPPMDPTDQTGQTGQTGQGGAPRAAGAGLAAPRSVDVLISLADARLLVDGATAPAPVPPSRRGSEWVGLTPPRSGWERVATLAAGADWTEQLGEAAEAARTALAALGFAGPGGTVTAYRLGAWTRLSATAGHLLLR